MSHPTNRLERFLIGKNHGIRRAVGFCAGDSSVRDTEFLKHIQVKSRLLRNTTKLCNCSMCRNPRKSAWKGKDKLTLQEKKMLQAND
jgi:hypothetical protein